MKLFPYTDESKLNSYNNQETPIAAGESGLSKLRSEIYSYFQLTF